MKHLLFVLNVVSFSLLFSSDDDRSIFGPINKFAEKINRLQKRPRNFSNAQLAEQYICAGNLNPLSYEGFDILETALRENDHATIKRLINAGLNTESRNDNVQTPLHLAIFHKNLQVVQMLIHAGANVNNASIGLHPLHVIAIQAINKFEKNVFWDDCAKILVYAGAQISPDEQRRTSKRCLKFIEKVLQDVAQEREQAAQAHATFNAVRFQQGLKVYPMIQKITAKML